MQVSANKNVKKRALLLFTNSFGTEYRGKLSLYRQKNGKALHNLLLKRVLSVISESAKSSDFDLIVSTDQPAQKELISAQFKNSHSFIIQKQSGGDFGERFSNSVKSAFDLGYSSLIVLGNDCPDISSAIIKNSFEKLGAENSAVVGPSVDGGFYLLGINEYNSGLFKNIAWQTNRVLGQLCDNAEILGKSLQFESVLADIDNNRDLISWFEKKSSYAEKFKKILFELFNTITFARKIIVPFLGLDYFYKRVSQKSPPFISLNTSI